MKFIHILQLIWWIALVILLFWNPFFGFMLIIGTCVVDFIKKKWNEPFLTIVTKRKKKFGTAGIGMDFKYFILLFIVRKKYQTAKMLRAELINYTFYYRLVSSKVNTHDVKSSEYRKFKEKHYPFFEHKNREIVDIL